MLERGLQHIEITIRAEPGLVSVAADSDEERVNVAGDGGGDEEAG